MALLYLDTSALVKLYINEPGTERMKELASEGSDNSVAICSITQVELHAAIWRRHRIRELDDEEVELAIELFNGRLETDILRCPVDDRTLNRASELTSRHPLRGYDATQLAACLVLETRLGESPTFVCADHALLAAAAAEGLPVLDPAVAEDPPGLDPSEAEGLSVLDPAAAEEPPGLDTEGD